MPESKIDYDARQAREQERGERWERENRHRDPGSAEPPLRGPTRYVLKHENGWLFERIYKLGGSKGKFWTYEEGKAKQFNSATEASLYAIEHNITDVEIVAV